ncbi:MAG TPA: hypothetical protein DEF45_18890 [Rhodopirellula sp.]|nr:hypothetical protein [Rhodopirellula sp.]
MDAIRIERVDDDAAIPLFSAPSDASMVLNHNDAIAEDTNLDGAVTSLDALLVINAISSGFVSGESLSSVGDEIHLTDVNADGYVTALDALTVLNAISRVPVLEGESVLFGPEQLRVSSPKLPDGSDLETLRQWGRCQEEIGREREERDAKADKLSAPSDLDISKSESLNSSSADVVFGGENAIRHASALAEERLDQFFTELEDELELRD